MLSRGWAGRAAALGGQGEAARLPGPACSGSGSSPGHPVPCPVPLRAAQVAAGLRSGHLGQMHSKTGTPTPVSRPPPCPRCPRQDHAAMSPKGSQSPFSIPLQLLWSTGSLCSPQLPPYLEWGVPGCPARHGAGKKQHGALRTVTPGACQSKGTGDITPWEGGDTPTVTETPSACPAPSASTSAEPGCPRAGGWLCGDHRVMLAACGHLGTGSVPGAASGQMPAGDSAAAALAGKDLPTPPGSALSASQETKALFVLSQATQEIGKVLNFRAGATAFATLLLSLFPDLAGTSLLL